MFSLDWKSVIFAIINIYILYLFLKKFLFGPVTAMMDKRTQTITDSLDKAKEEKEAAEMLHLEYAKRLTTVEAEAAEILKDARERAELEYNNKIIEAQEATARIMSDANKAIEIEKARSIKNAQDEIAAIAILATSKIIGRNVDDNTNKQLLGEFMKEVGAAK